MLVYTCLAMSWACPRSLFSVTSYCDDSRSKTFISFALVCSGKLSEASDEVTTESHHAFLHHIYTLTGLLAGLPARIGLQRGASSQARSKAAPMDEAPPKVRVCRNECVA